MLVLLMFQMSIAEIQRIAVNTAALDAAINKTAPVLNEEDVDSDSSDEENENKTKKSKKYTVEVHRKQYFDKVADGELEPQYDSDQGK